MPKAQAKRKSAQLSSTTLNLRKEAFCNAVLSIILGRNPEEGTQILATPLPPHTCTMYRFSYVIDIRILHTGPGAYPP